MATEEDIHLEAKQPGPTAGTAGKRHRSKSKQAGSITAEEARRAAKEVVLQSAADMVRELIVKSGGNYLTVRFLFELAGLIGEAQESEASEPSPLLRYYLEGIRNTKHAGEANNEAKSESVY